LIGSKTKTSRCTTRRVWKATMRALVPWDLEGGEKLQKTAPAHSPLCRNMGENVVSRMWGHRGIRGGQKVEKPNRGQEGVVFSHGVQRKWKAKIKRFRRQKKTSTQRSQSKKKNTKYFAEKRRY